MDFFKFNPTGEQTVLERGEIINNIDRSTWVEKYSTPGEFTFEAKVSSGLKDSLPKGSIISHIDTAEVGIVENHAIEEVIDEDPTIVVSGRTFPSYLENRIVGSDQVRASSTNAPYEVTSAKTWIQIKNLIVDHLTSTAFTSDSISGFDIEYVISGGLIGTSEARTINRGTLWERVNELLTIDDLGIRTVRPNVDSDTAKIQIYNGLDLSKDVMFSWRTGDLDQARYLFSQKNSKNAALVSGQYVSKIVTTSPDRYDRRFMLVDASDIDGHLSGVPTGGDLAAVLAAMTTRGKEAIRNQNNVAITQADISNMSQYQFRKHYNIGDKISIIGGFEQLAVMRVVEYAEIEDEDGRSGHPTLAFPLSEDS